jgi:2'-deoxynucleoside 5'-phosphate N-hydrolase
MNKIYISGVLTYADENIRPIYEKIGKICIKNEYKVYIPHINGTDPINNPEITPFEVWEKDYLEVESCDLIIAYIGKPSLGTGAELEIARITNSKIIVWWYKDEKVSRMARGNPAIIAQLEVQSEDELYLKIDELIKNKYEK